MAPTLRDRPAVAYSTVFAALLLLVVWGPAPALRQLATSPPSPSSSPSVSRHCAADRQRVPHAHAGDAMNAIRGWNAGRGHPATHPHRRRRQRRQPRRGARAARAAARQRRAERRRIHGREGRAAPRQAIGRRIREASTPSVERCPRRRGAEAAVRRGTVGIARGRDAPGRRECLGCARRRTRFRASASVRAWAER